ncbi:MAG: Gfo/Idh/MocA family oxidoreductase [Planctomycetota bacterium]|nr:Gfo/Idh/MocA family oxidoreductase [Planctomycetota bacterium]
MSQLRIAILGAGFMGAIHGKNLMRMDGVTVAAICSKPIETANNLCAELGLKAAVYDDFALLLKREPLDALYVCLPPFAHSGEVESAARRGIHLFLEKPIAFNAQKAAKMVRAIERAGVKSQVGFHFRFRKSIQAMKRLIADSRAGMPVLFEGRYWTNMLGKDWWRDNTRCRAQVFEQIIHLYDLAAFLFGKPIAVSGMMANLCHLGDPSYTIEDTSIGTMRFSNGAMAVVTGTNCAVPMHFFGDFRMVFEKATLEYTCTGQPWIKPDTAIIYLNEKEKHNFIEDGDPYFEETKNFINAIKTDAQTLTPARDGLNAIRVVEAVMKSAAANGRKQQLIW